MLENIIDATKPVKGLNVEITISAAPRNKEELLDDDGVIDILEQIENNPRAFSKAHLTYLNEYNKTEHLNLLNAIIFDIYEFTLPSKQRLNPDSVLYEMNRLYLGDENTHARKIEINRAIL